MCVLPHQAMIQIWRRKFDPYQSSITIPDEAKVKGEEEEEEEALTNSNLGNLV